MKNLLSHDLPIDADLVHPGLLQGSAPPRGSALADLGIDLLVLCAEELVPGQRPRHFPGVRLHRAPMDDGDLIPELTAHEAALRVARAVRRNQQVLVTCAMGWNRSGLVSALALWYLTGAPGRACVQGVQRARPGALRNPWFAEYLRRLPARPARRLPSRRAALAELAPAWARAA